MSLTARTRRLHRFLGVVIGLQIVLWVASGIYFAWTDINDIRGKPLREPSSPVVFDPEWVSPGEIDFAGAAIDPPPSLRALEIVEILGEPHYRLRFAGADGEAQVLLANARSGAIRGPLERDEALALARASFSADAEVIDVVPLTEADVGPHHEYRGRPLPAWRIRFGHDSRTHVYVSAEEARVVTHRNRAWRIFDALWMLHTMDYLGRDDFNNPLLRAMSLLALAVAATGYLMWYRTRPKRRRRGGASQPGR